MVLVASSLQDKLTQTIKYLTSKIERHPIYQKLIDELISMQSLINSELTEVTIVSHDQNFINVVRNLSLFGDRQNHCLTTVTLPTDINKLVNNCELILLVLDPIKPRTHQEHTLIKRASSSTTILGIITISHDSPQQLNIDLKQQDITKLNIFNLFHDNLDSQYQNFLISLINQSKPHRELKLKKQTLKTINRSFEETKKEIWQNIKQQQNLAASNQNLEQVQQLINQLPHRCNRSLQNYFRIFKQNSNQHKTDLVNPFLSDSLMHKVQTVIQDTTVIKKQDREHTYLYLILKNQDYVETIHSYVLAQCQQSLETWLKEEWHKITTEYNDGGLNQLHQKLQLEIQNIAYLSPDIRLVYPKIEPQLNIEKYICPLALENNSRIPFDYHYSQSTWFRLLIAVIIGGTIFLITQRLFGFILLIVQIINLLTGQDTKAIKLRQQTKEIKRIVDSKYQFLVRLLGERANQTIATSLDNINQDYQEQLENISQIANQQLQGIKQGIDANKTQIEDLNKAQTRIQKIFQD